MEWLWFVGYILVMLVSAKILYNNIYSSYVYDQLKLIKNNMSDVDKFKLAIRRADNNNVKIFSSCMAFAVSLVWPAALVIAVVWKIFAYLCSIKSIQPQAIKQMEKLKAEQLAKKVLEKENKEFRDALKNLRDQGIQI